MTAKQALDRVFAPQSVAIVGSTPREPQERILETLVASGFRGSIYLVSARADQASGRKVYRSVAEIPGPVDYVASCTPAAQVLPLLRECAFRQVGAVAILADGFAEAGSREGVMSEREISVLARETGLRVLGPNCLGVYCPRANISFDSRLPLESGRMGFIGQGRGISLQVIRAASKRGVRFSKAICYGDACDIGESDLLEYLAQDGDTDTVAACIENVDDGPRLFRTLKNLSAVKPVILLRTERMSGERNGMTSGDDYVDSADQTWSALLRQTGAVGVTRAEDMVDTMVTFSLLPRPRGRRVGIFGAAGGASVLATDAWSSTGFVIPPVPPQLRAAFDETAMNQAGMILHNPLDFSMSGYTDFFYGAVKRMMAEKDFVDISVVHNPSGQGAWLPWPFFESLIRSIANGVITIHQEVPLPMVLVMHYIHSRRHWQKIFEDLQVPCAQAGVPVYYSMGSAARAIDRMLRHYDRNPRAGRIDLTDCQHS